MKLHAEPARIKITGWGGVGPWILLAGQAQPDTGFAVPGKSVWPRRE